MEANQKKLNIKWIMIQREDQGTKIMKTKCSILVLQTKLTLKEIQTWWRTKRYCKTTHQETDKWTWLMIWKEQTPEPDWEMEIQLSKIKFNNTTKVHFLMLTIWESMNKVMKVLFIKVICYCMVRMSSRGTELWNGLMEPSTKVSGITICIMVEENYIMQVVISMRENLLMIWLKDSVSTSTLMDQNM